MSLHVGVVASSDIAGGAESYLVRLYQGLADRHGVRVTLVGDVPGWPDDLGERIPVGAGPKLSRQRPLRAQAAGTLSYLARAASASRRLDVDVFHVQYFREKLVLPRLLARRAPVLWTEHGPLPSTFPTGGPALLRWQAARSAVVAVSVGVEESLRRAGIPASTIPNPLPSSVGVADDRIPGEPVTVVYAGRLHRAKRVDLLVEAGRARPELRILIAGEGPAAASLAAGAPENVHFLGHRIDALALIAAADAVVLPSGLEAREGSPLMVLEARSFGVPAFVAADCHAAAEAVELGGVPFDPDAQSLADALAGLAVDGPRHAVAAHTARGRTERAWLDRHFAVLDELAGSRAEMAEGSLRG